MSCLRILISNKALKNNIFSLSFLTGVLFWIFCPVQVKAAGIVTDTLTVKVGYWGMETEDFAEKGTYHWTELQDALPLHDVAYSFYRDGSGKINGTYGTVVDSARGFYIEDLIAYAGINLRDIQSIQFYTADVDIGYFTSFTYNELFSSERYFFHDLASYFKVIYKNQQSGSGVITSDETSGNVIVIGEDKKRIDHVELDPAVWSDKEVVRPMLALEDSWVSYDLPVEGTAPDFVSLGTANRFRLLFGQATPTEQKTNQTAKYVHTLYVMLDGTPKVTEDDIKLPDKLGSNSITFNVSAADEAMINQLIAGLEWTSSDESVLKITDINITAASQYDDAVEVTIQYDILKEGEVTINGSYLGISVSGSIGVPAQQNPEEPQNPNTPQKPGDSGNPENPQNPEEPQAPDDPQGMQNPEEPQSPDGSKDADGNSPYDGKNNRKSGGNGDKAIKGMNGGGKNIRSTDAGFETAANTGADSGNAKGAENNAENAQAADGKSDRADKADRSESEVGETLSSEGGVTMYTLDEQVAQLLAEREDALTYDELIMQEKEEKKHLPAIGAGAAALFAVGIGGGYGEFKKRK